MALATRTACYPHRTAAAAAAAHTHRPRATAPLAARTTPLLATCTAAAHTRRTAPYPHRLLPAPHRHCCPYLPPAFYPHCTAEQPIPTTRALLLATRTAASHIRPTAHDPHHSIPTPLATCTAPPLLLPACYCPAHYPHYTTARYPHRAAAAAHTRRLLATRTALLLLPIPTTRALLLATRTATAHTRPTAHNPHHSISTPLATRTAPPLLPIPAVRLLPAPHHHCCCPLATAPLATPLATAPLATPARYCPACYPRHTIACYPHCTAAAAHTRCPLAMHRHFSPTARRCFPPHCTSAPPLATNFTQAAAHRHDPPAAAYHCYSHIISSGF
ncbi:hypothetical protein JR316_0005637 [Psilocybe cubensis]|uniref:Uncharacterized protein n=2 Tax=Psilocybe cubensis TaxID=181762 RepID=A0ACB8H0A8_PSICU|nr:hypothetical protein JR316_0005637 [Psilocybe cubensis]KAH9481117.1 hypothetical protein JR316_0005637 [Psilocybe cubensis]